MRLSESLRKGVMETPVGAVINRFKIKKRRTNLFFEDILAGYIRTCEAEGYGEKMALIGEKWSFLAASGLTKIPVRRIPTGIFFMLMKNVWTNIGILEDLKFERKKDTIRLSVKGNSITRIIGKNEFERGCFTGILKACLGSDVSLVSMKYSANTSEYVFCVKKEKAVELPSKGKEKYDRLNDFHAAGGFTLKDAIKKKVFIIRSNRIFFRGESICNSENTLFHIIGNEDVLMDRIAGISFGYFGRVVKKDASPEQKLQLIKNVLQAMGWGAFRFVCTNGEIKAEVFGPPYGLQTENDNWNFLARVILGYLWTIDRKFTLVSIKMTGEKRLQITYHKS